MANNRARRAVIYARISVSSEESVSIGRQVESARQYAAARGWQVVAEPFVDDGVSASKQRPADRAGWQALLSSAVTYDAVIIWKLDRLARRVLDFHLANEALKERGAGLVAVENAIDMATADGRLVAGVLAQFAEYEAEAISARVEAARTHLVRAGRVVGGTIPYGWRRIPNPEGPGYVLAQDPERIDWVRGMVDQALAGKTVYSVMKWLDSEGAPLPSTSQKGRKHAGWAYSTVERLLRNPVLAGMTPYTPGRQRHGRVDPTAVLRDENGLPVVDESVAIIGTDERRRLLAVLDNRDSPQARPRTSKGRTSPLLSRLVFCDPCDVLMHRGTIQGRPMLSCPECHQTISGLAEHLVKRLLDERGDKWMYRVEHVELDPSPRLGDIEQAIRDTAVELTHDNADVEVLTTRLANLKEMRINVRQSPAGPVTWQITNTKVARAWAAQQSDDEGRRVMVNQIQSVRVRRGRRGRGFDPSRVLLSWRDETFTPKDDESVHAFGRLIRTSLS